MKKTLIALTLAALPVAASADVILYGQIKGGVETAFLDKKGGVKAEGTTTGIVDYGSRIGFKGHEQLNGDLKAIWQLEQKVDIAGGAYGKNGSNGFGTRDSFIGLASDKVGTIKAGYLSTPVKNLNGKLDEWEYDSSVLGLGTFTRGSDASKRAVAASYTTPNMGGFSATAYVSPSDNNSEAVAKATGRAKVDAAGNPVLDAKGNKVLGPRDAAIYGLSASYENAGFFADAAGTYVHAGANNGTYDVRAGTNIPFENKKGYQALGQVGYDNGTVLAGVAYQRAQHVDVDYDVTNEVAATVAYKAAPNLRLKGTAAYGFDISDAGGNKLNGSGKYYQGIIGADYDLSKRTQVNGQVGYYQSGKDSNKVQQGAVGVGLKHKF